MTRRAWIAAAVAVAALAAPAAASAHAYLTKTAPAASVTLNAAPRSVSLTFDEAVEPRFALILVSDANGHAVTAGTVSRSPADPDTLVVPLKKLPEGWYLVYWRAISVDGHPVQGVFTFAVGPNPGPPPQFVPPHVSASATSTPVVIARWLALLTTMSAVGLFVMRMLIARPVVARVEGTRLRAVSRAVVVATVLGLIALPVYVEESTAIDSLRSFWAIGTLVPLWRTTAFGRAYVDMLICFALFSVAAWAALWVDRPEQSRRSVASLLALSGALAAAAAVLVVPAAGGHAAQTSPRGLSVLLDWLHVVSAAVWLGGLIGLLVLWRSLAASRRVAGLVVAVPRFSNVAFVSVLVLLGSGIGASIIHLPVFSALWQTTYGVVILIKAGILAAAMALGAVNLLHTKPQLRGAGETAARLLRRLITVEALLVTGAVLAAAVLSSLAPPPPAFAKEGSALAKVGPGAVTKTVSSDGYTLTVLVQPNRAVAPNSFALRLTRGGTPVRDANVTLNFAMLDMQMPDQEYQLTETAPGVYQRKTPALVMAGHWGLSFTVTPKGQLPFTATVVDRANG